VAENDKTIVSRIQHRRGLKQDLPQPLRPGELGLATDSRQLYIGGDPTNPATADYHSVSYYENTLSAKDHVASIANNNIIAFNVPCIRYVEGEFNGTSKVKSWQPTDARSILADSAATAFSDSTYPVFSPVSTASVSSTLSSIKAAGSFEMSISIVSGTDTTGNIRINDEIIISGYSGTRPKVNTVSRHSSGTYYIITIDQSINELASGTAVEFIPKHQKNIFTNQAFHSTDVTVVKKSIAQTGEASSTTYIPSGDVDFAIDGSNVASTGSHSLTLRTAPTVYDSIALTYYSNANVIASIEGVQSGTYKGDISSHVAMPSFYQNTTLWASGKLPSYKHFKKENIQISNSTGVGYVGLDLIHISSTADGANITATTGLTLGNLYIAREDEQFDLTSVVSSNDGETYVVTFNASGDAVKFQTEAAAGVYKYDSMMFVGQAGYDDEYLHRAKFAVSGVGGSAVTIAMPALPYTVSRSASANVEVDPVFPGNGFTNSSPTTCVVRIYDSTLKADEVKANDYVRIIDNLGDAASCELDDTLFKVVSTKVGSHFSIRIHADDILTSNANVTFTANIAAGGIKYVNHGSVEGNVNTTIQVQSKEHGIGIGTSNVHIRGATTVFPIGSPATAYDIKSIASDITEDTFYVENYPHLMATSATLITESGAGGLIAASAEGIMPQSELTFSSTAFKAVPVLGINLSGNTTVESAIVTVNKNLVEISGANVQIYPQLNWIPQDDEVKNAVYISQRPAYSSVSTGGLEFTLFEDKTVETLSVLGLDAKLYDRANNTVKAKFETWLNSTVNSRDVNLFSNVFPGDSTTYAILNPKSTNISTQYSLAIDNTFNEITFGSREESGIFNNIVNRIYGTSLYDKLLDTNKGTRGLVNLKNNIEISMREVATFGNKVISFEGMEQVILIPGDNGIPGTGAVTSVILNAAKLVASFDSGSTYNVFKVNYSISEIAGAAANKYIRTGVWTIAGRHDFTDQANAIVFNDSFSSHSEITTHSNNLVEPKFRAQMDNTGLIKVFLVNDQLEAETNTNITHNLGVQLKVKYIQDRWSASS
jgi:hypothetical protein